MAAVLFSLGLGAALMIGLGSRDATSEVAAGRAVRRMVSVGDTLTVGDVAGTVVAIQSVAVELDAGSDDRILLPHTAVLGNNVAVTRAASD